MKNSNSELCQWVGDWSGQFSRLYNSKPALYDFHNNHRYSFTDIDARAKRWAHYLEDSYSLSQGDRVAVLSKNRVEQLELFFACGKLGLVFVPLSYHATADENSSLLNRVNPSVVIYKDELGIISNEISGASGYITFSEAINAVSSIDIAKANIQSVHKSPEDICMLAITSGSTGQPKICQISYRQLLWNVFEIQSYGTMALNQKELVLFPFYNLGGLNSFLVAFCSGRETVFLQDFDSESALKAIQQEKVSHFGTMNVMLKFMINDPLFMKTDFSSIAGITVAGASPEQVNMVPFWDRGRPVSQAYGMTEAGPSNFADPGFGGNVDDVITRSTTVGFPMMHCDYRIVDPITGKLIDDQRDGVLLLRSPHNFSGYWDDDPQTHNRINRHGWINTNDVVSKALDGSLRFIGRAAEKDVLLMQDNGLPDDYHSLPMDWVGNTLTKRRLYSPSRYALSSQTKRYIFEELDQLTLKLAFTLHHQLNLKQGDELPIVSTQLETLLIYVLACWKIGVCPFPMHKESLSNEILLGNSNDACKVVVIDEEITDFPAEQEVRTIDARKLLEESKTSNNGMANANTLMTSALRISGESSFQITHSDLVWSHYRFIALLPVATTHRVAIDNSVQGAQLWYLLSALLHIGAELLLLDQTDRDSQNSDIDFYFCSESVAANSVDAQISTEIKVVLVSDKSESESGNQIYSTLVIDSIEGIIALRNPTEVNQASKLLYAPYRDV